MWDMTDEELRAQERQQQEIVKREFGKLTLIQRELSERRRLAERMEWLERYRDQKDIDDFREENSLGGQPYRER